MLENPFSILERRLNRLESLLLEIKDYKGTTPPIEFDKPLTVKGAAEFLNLEPATIYSLVNKKSIPFCKISKRLYFSKQELSEWLKAGRKKTNAELAADATNYFRAKNKKPGKC